jgi:hypothetical protein
MWFSMNLPINVRKRRYAMGVEGSHTGDNMSRQPTGREVALYMGFESYHPAQRDYFVAQVAGK